MIEDELARRESVEKAIRKAEFRATCLTWQELSDLIADRRSLIDALEKAQGEHDEIMMSWTGPSATLALIAERDSARALLRSARSVIILGQTLLRDEGFGQGTLVRIEKELAQ